MPHTLTDAAAAVGKNRTTILRAIKAGKISATRDLVSGDWLIEAAELFRVYAPADAHAMAPPGNALPRHDGLTSEIRELRTRLEAAETRLVDAQDQIQDLRRQRDAEAEERRKLTTLLTDRREQTRSAPRRSWWRPWRDRP